MASAVQVSDAGQEWGCSQSVVHQPTSRSDFDSRNECVTAARVGPQ